MNERPELPSDWREQFSEVTTSDEMKLPLPSIGDLIRDSRKTAAYMSEALMTRFSELEAYPTEYTFHDMPYDGGSVRVAITPADSVYLGDTGNPVWRVIIHQGRSIYKYMRPKEQWDLYDVLVQPTSRRVNINYGQATFTIGYGETTAPLPGMPPRIVRNVHTNHYSLRHTHGYTHTLPDVPLVSRRDRLSHYQSYTARVGWLMETMNLLTEATEVEAAPNLQRDEDF
jgi:hypothetical protein